MSTLMCALSLSAQVVECAFTSIDEDIDHNKILYANTVYRVEGCIRVLPGYTLEIEPGTIVMFEKASKASLIVERGAYVQINGTLSELVNFVSDQKSFARQRGDWGGFYILGNAENNESGGIIELDEAECEIVGGGENNADSSGVIQYLNVMFSEYGMTGVGVGNKTVIDHIYVSQSADKGIRLLGCDARIKHTIVKDIAGSGYEFDFGDNSKMQYGIAVTVDTSAHRASGTNQLVISNNSNSEYATPLGRSIVSNFSLINPRFCGYTTLNNDFQNSVLYKKGAGGGVYNTVVTGSPRGLYFGDFSAMESADLALLNYSYNTGVDNTSPYDAVTTWPTNCALDIDDWILGTAIGACAQTGNDFYSLPYDLGYSNTICGATPSFLLGTTDLDDASFPASSDLDNGFFTSGSQKRGAINASVDWTGWKIWNEAAFTVCPENRMAPTGIANVANGKTQLSVYPNPANDIAYVEFNTENAGKVTVDVVNSLGQVVRSINTNTAKGKQSIEVETGGLSAGVYMVTVTFENGLSAHAKVMVK